MRDAQKAALLNFVRSGRGFLGVHSATDTFYTWPDYLNLVGGYFNGHPWHQAVTIAVVDPSDPLVAFLGNSLHVEDEIYQISDFDYRGSRVLLRLDPSSVDLSKTGVHQRFYLRRRTSILYGVRSRAVSLAGRPLPANPHERYLVVYAKVALADATWASRIRPCQRFGPSWSAAYAPGQVRQSGRATGQSASSSRPGIASRACQFREGPQADVDLVNAASRFLFNAGSFRNQKLGKMRPI